jgi:hypothetical protein
MTPINNKMANPPIKNHDDDATVDDVGITGEDDGDEDDEGGDDEEKDGDDVEFTLVFVLVFIV